MNIRTKYQLIKLTVLGVILIINACATSNDVVSNSFFQKRKHSKGWFVKKKNHFDTQKCNANTIVSKKEQMEGNESSILNQSKRTIPALEDELYKFNRTEKVTSTATTERKTDDYQKSINEHNNHLASSLTNKLISAEKETSEPKTEGKKLEPMGVIGLSLGLAAALTITLALGELLGIVALVSLTLSAGLISMTLGILSLVRIKKNPNRFRGSGYAITSLILGILMSGFGLFLLWLYAVFNF